MTNSSDIYLSGRSDLSLHPREDDELSTSVNRLQLTMPSSIPKGCRRTVYWESPPAKVLVAATPHSPRARAALPVLCRYLMNAHDLIVFVEEQLRLVIDDSGVLGVRYVKGRVKVSDDIDFVICLGGDGSILHIVSQLFPQAVPPIMPFNLGSMGFLTPFDFADHSCDITNVLKGQNASVTFRMRLRCTVIRRAVPSDGTQSPCFHNFEDNMLHEEDYEVDTPVKCDYHVLNELVIDRGPAPYLCNLEVLCDECPVTRVQADGLIVATPTGSTAYSLSSGGSMVHPSVPAILFTPICPHSLSFRPVLFPDYVTLQIKVPENARASAWVSFDGRHRMELMRGDKVVVSASPWSVPTFDKIDVTADWFRSVSHCLRWNERVQQEPIDQHDNTASVAEWWKL